MPLDHHRSFIPEVPPPAAGGTTPGVASFQAGSWASCKCGERIGPAGGHATLTAQDGAQACPQSVVQQHLAIASQFSPQSGTAGRMLLKQRNSSEQNCPEFNMSWFASGDGMFQRMPTAAMPPAGTASGVGVCPLVFCRNTQPAFNCSIGMPACEASKLICVARISGQTGSACFMPWGIERQLRSGAPPAHRPAWQRRQLITCALLPSCPLSAPQLLCMHSLRLSLASTVPCRPLKLTSRPCRTPCHPPAAMGDEPKAWPPRVRGLGWCAVLTALPATWAGSRRLGRLQAAAEGDRTIDPRCMQCLPQVGRDGGRRCRRRRWDSAAALSNWRRWQRLHSGSSNNGKMSPAAGIPKGPEIPDKSQVRPLAHLPPGRCL